MLRFNSDVRPNAFWHKVRRPFLALTALTGYAGVVLLSAHMSEARPATSPPVVLRQTAPAPHQLTPHQLNLLRRQAAHSLHVQLHFARLQAAKRVHGVKIGAHLAKVIAQNQALSSGNVVQAAYAFRGTRYVMGGTSRSGFDCSGFVRYILGATGGVDLPRTATEQYYHGSRIPADQLQPGDLVFFKNTYKRGISHVGIYAGQGKFIHAANAHKGVRMDNLSDRYFQSHYAGARRVLPAQMRTAAGLP